ncbi:potassium-transporting ATPase subunit KdpA, partial [Asticcacaulis benevestitus]
MSQFITGNSWLQLALYMAVLLACVVPLGGYMAKVFQGEKTFMSPVLGWLENGFYALSGIDRDKDMSWKDYAIATLVFSAISFVLLYAVLVFQNLLPLNPQKLPGLTPDLSFNTAV